MLWSFENLISHKTIFIFKNDFLLTVYYLCKMLKVIRYSWLGLCKMFYVTRGSNLLKIK